MTERWPEVLDAYDARLAVGGGMDRRADMLEEAARIAKDFIGDHARAVGYLDQLFRLRPGDGQVASSLERCSNDTNAGPSCRGPARSASRCWPGRRPGSCDFASRRRCTKSSPSLTRRSPRCAPLLPDLHEDAPLAGLLERLLGDERAASETRLEALDALRLRYEATGAGARVPELLLTAIRFAEGPRLLRPAPRVR